MAGACARVFACSCVGHTSSLPVARVRRSYSRKKALALPFQFFLLSGVSAGVSAAGKPIAAGQPSRFFLSPFFVLSRVSPLRAARFRRSYSQKKALALPFQFSLLPGVSSGVSAAGNPIAAGQPSHAHVALLSLSIFYLQSQSTCRDYVLFDRYI